MSEMRLQQGDYADEILAYLREALELIAQRLSVEPQADYGPKPNGVLLADILAALPDDVSDPDLRCQCDDGAPCTRPRVGFSDYCDYCDRMFPCDHEARQR